MHVQYVNGTPCYNCSDVERAKKAALDGQNKADDPLHPSTTVTSSDQSGDQSSTDSANPATTVTPTQAVGVNQPLASGDRGTSLNIVL